MTEYKTNSPEKTEALGERLAEAILKEGRLPAYVAMFGEMGVGKTAFTRGFCRALEIRAVRSPTYTVVNEYRGGRVPVFHFDFYRMEEEDELISIGFEDYLKADGVCLSEWSERFPDLLPLDAIRVSFARTDGENGRSIEITGVEL